MQRSRRFGDMHMEWLSLTGIKDKHGDMTNANHASGVSHKLLAAMVIASAVIDGISYLHPQWSVLPYIAGTSKVLLGGIAFFF